MGFEARKGWLEDDPFLLGRERFRGKLTVKLRGGRQVGEMMAAGHRSWQMAAKVVTIAQGL